MKKSILLVDDDSEFLDLLSGILEYNLGVQVFTCPDGDAVLALINKHRVNLVITDTNMPKVNGVEVLKAMRKSHPDIPVVVLFSGLDGSSITADEILSLGALAVVSKPEAIMLIADIIEKLPTAAGED